MAKRFKSRSSSADLPATSPELRLFRIPGIPEIRPGDDLVKCVASAARRSAIYFKDGDILVFAQKIVSKAEGTLVRLASVKPSPEALAIAGRLKKDPRAIEVVLRESRRIVRSDHVLIAETRHGFVCANAGVDHSNVPGDDIVTLLPRDPDKSARNLAAALRERTGKRLAVILSDTFGRPWRPGPARFARHARPSGKASNGDDPCHRRRARRRRRPPHEQVRRFSRHPDSRLPLQTFLRTRRQYHPPRRRRPLPLIPTSHKNLIGLPAS